MLKDFNKTFFSFVVGFVAILALSFFVIIAVGFYEQISDQEASVIFSE